MKLFFYLVIFFFLNNCSFDNKSGIWKSETAISKKDKNLFKEFKKISITQDTFNELIEHKKNQIIKISNPIENNKWNDVFYNDENNFKNFIYDNTNKQIYKSKKLTRNKVSKHMVFDSNFLIVSDDKGNIIIFSLTEKRITTKFNFYKKKYKKIKKKLNIHLENNIIYVSDNLGYLYSFDYKKEKVLWAINYKLPLKSNLKILKDKIVSSDINNNLIFFNKKNGKILKLMPTENTIITNQFVNNISKNKNDLFYLNSYGSLYSFDAFNMKLNWFINLSPSLNLDQSNLFYGSEVVTAGNNIIVSSNYNTYLINKKNGFILNKFNFSSVIKPIINNNIGFLVTKNNLLIAINLVNAEILYSRDINLQVAKSLNSKKKNLNFKNLMLLNNDLFLFLKNSFVLHFRNNGELIEIKKLPSKINTLPILIDSSILYLNFKNKLIVVN